MLTLIILFSIIFLLFIILAWYFYMRSTINYSNVLDSSTGKTNTRYEIVNKINSNYKKKIKVEYVDGPHSGTMNLPLLFYVSGGYVIMLKNTRIKITKISNKYLEFGTFSARLENNKLIVKNSKDPITYTYYLQ